MQWLILYIYRMENQTQITDSNPFKGRNAEEVWKEISKNSKPISKEEAYRKMKEAARMQKQKAASQSK